ncbi:MAG TPA: ATP-binding cassette domain-containing protein [Thermodesulfovibrionales bacterium]|nr:ATP-binding cassette domain-containing protein [Thermodesulfovibrionales bacterium]
MGLSVRLKKKVNGFSLDVAWEIGNELAVLFGHSGSGKSMTLQMITGLMGPDEGMVCSEERTYFDSAEGVDTPPQARSFGYVFQDPALFPHMTIMKNILFGAPEVPKKERLSRAQELIEAFKLTGIERRCPSEISGGQRQRVAFARALIRHPDLLLLDEPFSALDQPLRIEMRYLLKEIRRRFEIPVILVTHDCNEAAFLADRVIVYAHGTVVQSGSWEQVSAQPANPEVEMLVRPEVSSPQAREMFNSFCRTWSQVSRTGEIAPPRANQYGRAGSGA